MSEVRFSPVNGHISDYVLNHPTASPLNQNNISFRLGSTYLKDFSDKGIEKFVKQNNNRHSNKDLDFKEVGAFIQSVASNASNLAGATFDLADPELGLFKKDGINADHISAGFTLESKGTLPSQGVVFFDATASHFPLKDAEQAIKTAEKSVEKNKDKLDDAQGELKDAQYLRQRLVDFLGNDSVQELLEKESKVLDLRDSLIALNRDQQKYTDELNQLEEEHKTQPANPPSGLDQEARWKKIRELRRALRGLGAEIKETQKELTKTEKSITDKQGPLSFMAVGNSLSELRGRLDKVARAQDKVDQAKTELGQARATLDEAKRNHERIKNGEAAPVAETPAPAKEVSAPVAETPAPVVETPVPVAETPAPSSGASLPGLPSRPAKAPETVAQPTTSPQGVTEEELIWADDMQRKVVNGYEATPAEVDRFNDIMARYVEAAKAQGRPEEPTSTPKTSVTLTEEEMLWAQELEAKFQTGYEPTPEEMARYEDIFERYTQMVQQEQETEQVEQQQQSGAGATQPVRQPEEVFIPGTNAVYIDEEPSTPVQQTQPVTPVAETQSQTRPYQVKRGDTLSGIAKKELGDWRRWQEIHQLNREVIGTDNTHWIYPGQVLKLPRL